eukprot:1944803-Prorocentrum_lima.AAC.1
MCIRDSLRTMCGKTHSCILVRGDPEQMMPPPSGVARKRSKAAVPWSPSTWTLPGFQGGICLMGLWQSSRQTLAVL